MADDLIMNPGSGGSTLRADQLLTGQYVPFGKIMDGTADSTNVWVVNGSGQALVLATITGAAAVKSDVVTATTAAWTSATALNTALSLTVTGYSTVLVSINPTTTFTGGAIIFEVSDDGGTTWYPVQGTRVDSFTSELSYTIVANQTRMWQVDVSGMTTFRARLNPAITGTGTLNIRMQASDAGSEPAVAVGGTVTTAPPANASANVAQVAGTTVDTNSGLKSAGTQRVVLATDQPALTNALKVDGSAVTQPVSGTVTTTPPANASTNLAQVAGTTADTNSGLKSAGTLRVVLATDQPALTNALKVDPSAVTSPVSAASLPLPTGASTAAKQPALGTAGSPSADVITVQGAASMTALLTQQTPGTTGGYLVSRLLSAATTNATSVKASAGQVYGWMLFNTSASTKFLKLYNKASAPTVGTDTPFMTIPIPAGGGEIADFDGGIAMGTGIAFAITGAITDADTTAVALNDVVVNLLYK